MTPMCEFLSLYGTTVLDKKWLCSIQARQFDNYCQQTTIPDGANHPPKFGDYTNLGVDEVGDGTQCNDWQGDNEKFYCLAQDCIFEYCEWVRDDYLKNCLAIAGQWKAATDGEECREEDEADNCIRTKKSVTVTLNGESKTTKNFYAAFRKLAKPPKLASTYDFDAMTSKVGKGFKSDTCSKYLEFK